MAWAKQRLASSQAAWKVVGNEVMMMNAEVGPADATSASTPGRATTTEREELLAHIKAKGIKDVVFVTGDIHTFIAGDVRTQDSTGETVALEFVGGSITSAGLGETDLDLGGGRCSRATTPNPNTPPAVIDALQGAQPVGRPGRLRPPRLRARDRDPDELRRARSSACRRSRSKSTATLPTAGFHYSVARGQTSIKGAAS